MLPGRRDPPRAKRFFDFPRSTRRLFSKTDKQIVLACFRAGLALRAISNKLGIPFLTVSEWHERFLKGDRSWAAEDDLNLIRRQKAWNMFEQGCGYKRVATELGITQSCAKYWMRLCRVGKEQFFTQGSSYPKKYPEERKNEILNKYAITTESKKKFCLQEGISVSVLNKWLRDESLNKNI